MLIMRKKLPAAGRSLLRFERNVVVRFIRLPGVSETLSDVVSSAGGIWTSLVALDVNNCRLREGEKVRNAVCLCAWVIGDAVK